MSDLSRVLPEQLFRSVVDKTPAQQGELALAVVDLCERHASETEPCGESVARLLGELARQTTQDLRLRLAQQLASADWAPSEIVRQLAQDEIDIAEIVIQRSRVLLDRDLITLAQENTLAHRVAIAGRQDVSEPVTDAVAIFGEPDALTALAANRSAHLSHATFERCIEAAASHQPMRQPLAEHPELPADLVPSLYAIVGEELRKAIVARFDLDEKAIDASLGVVGQDAVLGDTRISSQDVDAATLVERLASGDRLTASIVVQAADNEQRELCECAMARLAGMTVEELRRVVSEGGFRALALACRAADVPSDALASIAQLVLDDETILADDADASSVAISEFSRTDAMDALRALQHTP